MHGTPHACHAVSATKRKANETAKEDRLQNSLKASKMSQS
jgi:hypothetical protein